MNLKFEDLRVIAEQVDKDLFGEVRNENLLLYLEEEVNELKQENMAPGKDQRFNQVEEFGDIIFCLVAYARQNEIDINHALSLTICKLQDRIKRNGQ